jgi:acyl dehydratase
MTPDDEQASDPGAEPPARVVEQRGLWFEEFEPEVIYRHAPGRTFSAADNTLFSGLTMNPQALHVDAEWSAHQPFGAPLINSMLTLATLVGLSVEQLSQGTIVANLGFTQVRFPAPMYAGDTLRAESRVLATRLSSSRPGTGIVTLEHTGRNQDGVVVATAVRSVMVNCRPIPSEQL